ncbi:MAG: cyclopropane-fatty-acyl-phospholipid synthase family protein [Pirellulales bacterium]
MIAPLISLAERQWLPDWAIRVGIRKLLSDRLKSILTEDRSAEQQDLIAKLQADELAVETEAANEQHYEIPAAFFEKVLGKRLKYSCGWFESEDTDLDQAEEAMLDLTCQRAEIQPGQEILELGCGWGSLTVWMAEKYPACQITAISNSHSQRHFIEQRLKTRGLTNARILTQDMRSFQNERQFDRIVSVEMFEHMRNYRQLFDRISGWLNPDGRLFVHIFCHQSSTYLFETEGANNWMGRHFFTGGTMPSVDLFSKVQQALKLEQQWNVNGLHYWRTCEHWLKRLDDNYGDLATLFKSSMPAAQTKIALQRWRMFMLACAELFRYEKGSQWFVSHYLFSKR